MKKSLLLQLSLCVVLCLIFACKQDTAEAETETPSTSSHDLPVPKIKKTVLSQEELSKLTRYQDKGTGKYGYKNEKGEVLTKPIYDAAMAYRETDFVRVSRDKKFGFVGLDGSEVIPVKYDDAGIFTEGMAAVKVGNKWGYIDKSGTMIAEPKYNFTLRFYEGMSSVQRDGKWGYINKTGQEVIPVEYEATGYFNNGLASVRKNGKWGYIDMKNNEAIPFQFQRADPFGMYMENAARVTKDGVTYYINKKGKCVKDCPKK